MTATKPGHLRHGALQLKQTEEAKKKMGRGQRIKFAMQKLKAPALDWKRK